MKLFNVVDKHHLCPTCGTWWKAPVEGCPSCDEAHAAVRRIEALADALASIPQRLAKLMTVNLHPYDIADAIRDALAPEVEGEPLAEWERALLFDEPQPPA